MSEGLGTLHTRRASGPRRRNVSCWCSETQRRNSMRFSRFGPWSNMFPAALLIATMVVGSVGLSALTAQAQDEEDEPHPAHIHDGSCATLGGIAFPLNDAAYDGTATGNSAMGGTPAADMAMGETVGSSSAVPLET